MSTSFYQPKLLHNAGFLAEEADASSGPGGAATLRRAIELFVAEEGQHARWLGVLRRRFGGEQLTSHWSDGAFVALRHVGGLRREICVLLTAEVIALTYYRVLARPTRTRVLAAASERILLDDRGHVAFHRATLAVAGVSRREFEHVPPGHDSCVVGDEPHLSLHFLGSDDNAA